MISAREKLAEKFRNKEYRDAFVAEQIFARLPLKIRTIREDQDLTQKELGELADMAQTWVSKLEDPNYGKLTISTLLKLASAFDVALQIDFVPYSRILDGAVRLHPSSFSVPKFEEDKGLFYSLGEQGASNVCLGASESEPIQFPVQAVVSDVESARTPPQSASEIVNQQDVA